MLSLTFEDCHDFEDALADLRRDLVQILCAAKAKPSIIDETGSADDEKKTVALIIGKNGSADDEKK